MWVQRKPFSQLSRRQQLNRLQERKQLHGSLRNNSSELNQRNSTNNTNVVPIVAPRNNYLNREDLQQLIQDDIPRTQSISNIIDFPEVQNNYNPSVYTDIDASVPIENVDTFANIKNLLRQTCLDMDLNHIQTKAILNVFRTHKCFKKFPKDSRTLLRTGRIRINLIPIGNGVYWHIGFARSLQKVLSLYDDNEITPILQLEISSDGLSLGRSNPMQYWPIQIRVRNISEFKPVMIGIYQRVDKPNDIWTFFQSLISEVEEATILGGILVKNSRIPFHSISFVGDAPARALVLNHYGHNSSSPCSKCKVSGYKFENRSMVYLGIDHYKRTDEEYSRFIDEDHQKEGQSSLLKLSIRMVTRVPFEVMHLVYMGVPMRILDAWYIGKFGFSAKLSSILLKELNSRFSQLKQFCPHEFARRPRPLEKYGKFKATELRHFILYAAPIILFGILEEKYYFHLLMLNTAMRILTSTDHSSDKLKFAEKALKVFVQYAEDLYTPVFVSYNVHCLLHLVDDAKELGPLEACSAFVYENNMPLFKKNIRNHPKPLQQFANRLKEKSDIQHRPKKDKNSYPCLLLAHYSGPVPDDILPLNYNNQYKKYESSKFQFIIDEHNNYCMMEDTSICKIENFVTIRNSIFAVVRNFQNISNFYEKPMKSSNVGVYKCGILSEDLQLIDIQLIKKMLFHAKLG